MKRILLLPAALGLTLAASGCFNPFFPTVLTERVTSAAPSPTTPENAVKLFEWCWENRGVQEYEGLFTADYIFQSAETDSAGNPTRTVLTHRDDEVETAQNMFVGSAERPPATKISLTFDRNLHAFSDTRLGKDPGWHRAIRTSVDLKVEVDDGNQYAVQGYALFYLTRGDSALIPADQTALGVKRDSLRWWIDRWEDETISQANVVAGRGAKPSGLVIQKTMEQVKAIFLGR